MATSKAEAEFIGARAPLPPTTLNFQAKKLFDALSVYMTWHDLANYAWLPDWTSDNWLVIDTLADIPGRIDVRWMCVPPDTLILGDNKPISEYRVGDETLYGGRVLEVFRRPYRGELVVIKGLGLLPIKVTPEHPILVVEGEIRWKYYRKNGRTMATTCKVFSKPYFIEAEKVRLAPARKTKGGYRFRRRGHYLVVPRLKGVYDVKEIDLSEYYRNYDLVPVSIRVKLGAKKPVLKLDEDLAWLFGFYVGDGSAWINPSVGQVKFYPSSEEHVKRIAAIIERYGFKATVLRHGRCYQVIWSCRALTRFFRENFGAHAREKRIPYFILLHKDERILRAFLQGYLDADGNKAWRRDGVYEALTVSKLLALQIQLLCFRLGISCGITLKREEQAGYRGDAYRLSILFKRDENHARIKFTDEFVLVPVVSVTREPYDGEVCNLETERNVYLVSNAIVHNCRFGLIDFMAGKGIGLKTPASQFTAVVEGAAKNPTLLMDLTLMSRLVQATGLHPYYVPIVTVAEAMQAFTDERTLLRTGIVDLYERGLADLQALDDLMSDLSVLSFKVAYFDMQAMDWKEGFVNVPLSFLPGERKLIEMRAVIDRYMSIYGKALTEIVGGVRSLVLKPDEAKERLSKFADYVAKALSAAMKSVIGRGVQFKPDGEYLNAWLAYAQLLADIEQAERLRTFVSRIGGWLLYRVATGYVSDDELARVVAVLRNQFYMTETEAKAIFALAAAMRDIAKREPVAGETLPTLSTLATMAEYIEVPLDYVQRILAERRVERTYAELWFKYIAARTISSEVNTLASTYRRIVEYFGLPETLEKQVKELMRAGGWTEREIQIFDLDLGLRRAYRILSTFIPTLRQFVGDAMYLGEWEKLFDDLLRARGLDAERYKAQVEYYKKLIKSRKLWRRVSMYITELVNCYAYGVIDEQTLRKELAPLKTYGLDDGEIDLIVKTAEYRAARIAATRRR
jgi:intein/homing endonuclease